MPPANTIEINLVGRPFDGERELATVGYNGGANGGKENEVGA